MTRASFWKQLAKDLIRTSRDCLETLSQNRYRLQWHRFKTSVWHQDDVINISHLVLKYISMCVLSDHLWSHFFFWLYIQINAWITHKNLTHGRLPKATNKQTNQQNYKQQINQRRFRFRHFNTTCQTVHAGIFNFKHFAMWCKKMQHKRWEKGDWKGLYRIVFFVFFFFLCLPDQGFTLDQSLCRKC